MGKKPYSGGETQLVVNNSGKDFKGESKIVIKGWFEQIMNNPDAIYTEWDVEIYPQGLQKGLKQVWEKYHLPIFITENGVGVREDITVNQVEDDYRISFMNDHISAIMNAVDALVWMFVDIMHGVRLICILGKMVLKNAMAW